jgi:solute carrier family 35 protein
VQQVVAAVMAWLAGASVLSVAGYMCTSSVLLLLNKLAIYHLQAPSLILALQLICSAAAVRLAGMAGLIAVDALTWPKVKAFAPVSLAFVTLIFANIKTLQYANVETFIVFRSSTPVLISLCEFLFLGRQLPSLRGWMCLLLMVAGAATYAYNDAAFKVSGYSWVAVWYGMFVFDQIYVKHVVSTVKMESMWGRVYYSNLLAVPVLLCSGTLLTDESDTLIEHWSPAGGLALLASCVAGLSMSYFSWSARSQLSASHFTVIGNICKILTVTLNVAIWDQHATNVGLMALAVTLGSAFAYSPAPLRAAAGGGGGDTEKKKAA